MEGEDDALVESAGNEMVTPTVKSLSDLWLVDTDGKSKTLKEAHCSSCGALRHKWPKCRSRNIELMLVKIGAMISEPLLLPEPRASRAAGAAELLLIREVAEVGPEQANVGPAVEKNVEKSRKAKKREKVVTCVQCKGETQHESWRLFGMRCLACQDCFIHFVCTETKVWTCDACQVGLSVAEGRGGRV